MITTVCLNCGRKFEGRLDDCPMCRTGAIKYRGLDTPKPVKKETPKKEKSLKEMTESERRKAGFFTNRGGKIVPINKPEKPAKKKAPAKKIKKKAPKRRAY